MSFLTWSSPELPCVTSRAHYSFVLSKSGIVLSSAQGKAKNHSTVRILSVYVYWKLSITVFKLTTWMVIYFMQNIFLVAKDTKMVLILFIKYILDLIHTGKCSGH